MSIIKFIVDISRLGLLLKQPRYYLKSYLPFFVRCLIDLPCKPRYKNVYNTVKVYDGLTRNDFKKGSLVEFLYKIGVVGRPKSYDQDEYGIGYFIGYEVDD